MQSGALNTNRISIRGVGYREPFATTGIKIYLDEIPLTNGAGESSIEDIHPLILAGIDVWRGPSSALWGSGLGGMIHLKSKIPEGDAWYSGFQLGSYDRLKIDQGLSFRYGNDDQMATNIHYQYLHDSGYRDNNDYRKHSFSWLQQWGGREKGYSISSFFHAIDLKAFIPSSINENDYENSPYSAAPAWGAVKANEDYRKYIGGIHLKFSNSAHWAYNGALFGTFFDSDEVRPFNVLNEGNTSYGMRHRVTYNIRKTSHLHLGIEFFKEEYSFSTYETLDGGVAGDQLSDQEEHRTYVNSFLQSEFDLSERWVLFGGLHLGIGKITNPDLKSDFPLAFYPTAGLNYLLKRNITLSGSISRGYSNLSLDDILNSDGMIAPGIKPETGWSEEIAILLGDPMSSYARAGFYNMKIENTIYTTMPDENSFEKHNLGSSTHQGAEFEYQATLFENKFDVQGSYTFQFNQSEVFDDKEKIPGYPDHRTFNKLIYRPGKHWEIQLTHLYRSEIQLPFSTSQGEEGYQLVHIGTSHKFSLGPKWELSVSATVQNLFDIKYASMFQANVVPGTFLPRSFYPGKPRSFYVGINLKYDL